MVITRSMARSIIEDMNESELKTMYEMKYTYMGVVIGILSYYFINLIY